MLINLTSGIGVRMFNKSVFSIFTLLTFITFSTVAFSITAYADGGYEVPPKTSFMGSENCDQCADETSKGLENSNLLYNITFPNSAPLGFRELFGVYLDKINVCSNSIFALGYLSCEKWITNINIKIYTKNAEYLKRDQDQDVTIQISAASDPQVDVKGKFASHLKPRLALQLNGQIKAVDDVKHALQINHPVKHKNKDVDSNVRFVIPAQKNMPIIIIKMGSFIDVGGFLNPPGGLE